MVGEVIGDGQGVEGALAVDGGAFGADGHG